jgi:hypothetical protein
VRVPSLGWLAGVLGWSGWPGRGLPPTPPRAALQRTSDGLSGPDLAEMHGPAAVGRLRAALQQGRARALKAPVRRPPTVQPARRRHNPHLSLRELHYCAVRVVMLPCALGAGAEDDLPRADHRGAQGADRGAAAGLRGGDRARARARLARKSIY